jgi:transaldolase
MVLSPRLARASGQHWHQCLHQRGTHAQEFPEMDREAFDLMHSGDVMAVEKLKEGIDAFAADQRMLEKLIGQLYVEHEGP